MGRITEKPNILILAFLIVLLATFNANAGDDLQSFSSRLSIRIVGGNLSILATDIDFSLIDLSTDMYTAYANNILLVKDPTGTGAGWHVTAKGESLVSKDGKILSIDELDFVVKDIGDNQVIGISRSSQVDRGKPEGIGYDVKISTSEQRILRARPGEGMGEFQVLPNYELRVSPGSPEGDFSSFVTFSIYQGP